MRRAAWVLALALSPVMWPKTSVAFECYPPDSFRQVWWSHVDSEKTFVVVWGGFTGLHSPRHDRAGNQIIWQATFKGMSSSERAFDDPFTAPVTIYESLFSENEPEPNPHSQLDEDLPKLKGLVFLEVTPTGYAYSDRPCGGDFYGNPETFVQSALDCIHGRRCARPKQ